MNLAELLLLAIGLSMDAFAIAMCKGLSVKRPETKHLIIAGLWFGGAQALMPLLGYLLGTGFRGIVESTGPWIAFMLLVLIGMNMIRSSREEDRDMSASFTAAAMLPLAVAGSIDALVEGHADEPDGHDGNEPIDNLLPPHSLEMEEVVGQGGF